jgi:hypothetical protein
MLDYGCAVLIDGNDPPKHLLGIPDLDLFDDPCAEPVAGPWFRLGACSMGFGLARCAECGLPPEHPAHPGRMMKICDFPHELR